MAHDLLARLTLYQLCQNRLDLHWQRLLWLDCSHAEDVLQVAFSCDRPVGPLLPKPHSAGGQILSNRLVRLFENEGSEFLEFVKTLANP